MVGLDEQTLYYSKWAFVATRLDGWSVEYILLPPTSLFYFYAQLNLILTDRRCRTRDEDFQEEEEASP